MRARGATLLLSLLLLLVSCGPDSPPADLTIAHDSEPQTLDPALMTGVGEGRIAAALFEGLTRLDSRTLDVVPGVAESWSVAPDGVTWTFSLREAARWSDGSPVTAEDFRWSWLRVLEPETAASYAELLFVIEGARAFQAGRATAEDVGLRAPDARTLVVRLERPVPYFPSLAAFFTLLPVSRAAVEEHGDRWTRAGNIVTNGPFTLESRRFYRDLVLARSPTYWDRERIRAARIRLLPVTDPNTQFNLYESGVVDVVFSVPSPVVHLLSTRDDFVSGPRLATAFLRLNVTRPPLDDVRIRRAISLAIDRKTIVDRVTRGGEQAATAFVPPVFNDYPPAEGPTHDPAEARRLLSVAGHPGGKGLPRISILLPENPDYATIAAVLQHQLKATLGLEVALDVREWKVYLSSMRRLEYDLAFSQWIGDYLDPSTFLDCFRSESGNNRTGWKHDTYDFTLNQAEKMHAGEDPEAHRVRRFRMFRDAERILISEQAPIVTLFHPTLRYLVSPRIDGFAPNVLGLVLFRDLAREGPR